MRWGRTVVAAVVVAVMVPGMAAAARSWHPTLVISPSGAQAGDPAGAIGVRGEAIAAWSATVRGRARVEARVRRGSRSAWVRDELSGNFPEAPSTPAATIDGRGAAIVAWRAPGGAVRAAVRDRREAPWRVATVAPAAPAEARRDFIDAAVAFDPSGGATLVWAELKGGSWTIRAARRAGPGAAWRATGDLPIGAVSQPSLALAPSGAAVAAWTAPTAPDFLAVGTLRAAVRDPDGAWAPPAALSATGFGPAVAIADDGRAVVAWEDRPTNVVTASTVRLATGTAAGGWSAAETVTPGRAPRVATNIRGAVALTWATAPSAPDATPILAAIRPAGAPWPAPTTLTAGLGMTAIEAWQARVAMSATGRAYVAWLDPEGPGSATVGLTTALAGGPWDTTLRPVVTDSPGVSLVAAASGDALALLPGEGDRSTVIRAVDYDAVTRPVVRARVASVAAAGRVRWTVTVRNPGRVTARGVKLRLSICCGSRLVSAHPAGVPGGGPLVTWNLGTIGPGGSRAVCLETAEPAGSTPRLNGTLSAVAVAPTAVSAVARR